MTGFVRFAADLARSEKWRTGIVLLFLLWLFVFVPFAGFPALHLEEGIHVGLAKDIFLRHHWLAPKLFGVLPYLNKPPMLPWLIAVSAHALGNLNEWVARIPPLLATLAISLLVYWVVRPVVTQRAALMAAAAAMLTPSVMLVASVAETDVLSAAFSFAAFAVFLHGDRSARVTSRHWILCGVLMGCAALSKGPIPLIYPIGGIALFRLIYGERRDWAWLAISIAIAMAFLAIWVVPKLDAATRALWFREMELDNAVHPSSLTGWSGNMLWFLWDLFISNLPTDLLAIPVIWPAWRRRLGLPDRLACAFACYILVGTVVLMLASAGRARYALPVEPAFAAAAGLALEPLRSRIPRLQGMAVGTLVALALFQVIRSDIVTPLRVSVVQRNQYVGEAIDAEVNRAPAPLVLLGGPFDADCLFYLRPSTENLMTTVLPANGPAWILFQNARMVWPKDFEPQIPDPPVLDLLSRGGRPIRLYRFASIARAEAADARGF